MYSVRSDKRQKNSSARSEMNPILHARPYSCFLSRDSADLGKTILSEEGGAKACFLVIARGAPRPVSSSLRGWR
jgi:hypothetical protein